MEGTVKNLAPKIALAASAFGISLLLAPSAFAADAGNTNTGADSKNEAKVEIKNNVNIEQNNSADINNNITVNANTGGNSASKNTGDGSVNTGDINGSITINNDVNGNGLNEVGVNCSGFCTVLTNVNASNENTGADSDNEAKVEVENNIDYTQNNELDIDNNIDADLNTGDNEADKNTGDGSVKTGDINFDISVTNEGNNNNIGSTADEDKPSKTNTPVTKEEESILPEEGKVLAASEGLPVTGGSLPLLPAFGIVLAGLAMKRIEEIFRLRMLPESK